MKKYVLLILLFILAFSALLGGCSERLQKNDSIAKEAERNAERLAVEYIADKYGIEANALGYSIQGNDVFMAYEASTDVVVPMIYGDEQFCVSLNLRNEKSRQDNRQGLEVANTLETYILGELGLPKPVYSRLRFWTWGTEYSSATTISVDGNSYSADRMLDFYYDGQGGEDLLNRMKTIEFYGNFVQPGLSLQDVEMFDPAIWPAKGNGMHFSADLYLLSGDDTTDEALTHRRSYTNHTDWNGLHEYLSIDFTHAEKQFTAGVWIPSEERTFCTFRTTELSGISFVGMMPFDPQACIKSSDEKVLWRSVEDVYNDGQTKTEICEYEQISPLFYPVYTDDMLAYDAPFTSMPITSFIGFIPQAYINLYGDDLYVGTYWSDTQETNIDECDGFIWVSDNGTPGDAPHDAEKTPMQRALVRLISREIVEKDDSI